MELKMNRRSVLALSSLLPLATMSQAKANLSVQGVSLNWHWEKNGIHGSLTAPTHGWLAVGFNSTDALNGSRFLMAAATRHGTRQSERIAIVPGHVPIESLGLEPVFSGVSAELKKGASIIRFSLAPRIPDRPQLEFREGHATFVMLAWSTSPDFDHHSAWRRHFTITL